jgi:hypothetical protein
MSTLAVTEKRSAAMCVVGTIGIGGASTPTARTTTIPFMLAGDIVGKDLYAFAISRDSTSASADVTCTDTGTGDTWTAITSDADKKLWVFHKKGEAGDIGATVTIANCVGSTTGGCAVVRGAGDDSNDSLTLETNAAGDETHASITPASANSLVIFINGDHENDTNAVTNVSGATIGGFTINYEYLSSGGSDCRITLASVLQSGGPTATGDVTWDQSDNTTKTVLFAIAPAAGATPATVTPGAIARSFAVNAATAVGAAAAGPAAIARSFAVNATVVKGSAVVAPGAVTLAFVIPQVTIDDGTTPATVQPATTARSFALNQVVPVGGAVVQVGATELLVVLPASTPKASVTVAPATTARSFVLPLVTVEGGSVVETGIDVAFTLPATTQQGGAVVEVDSTDLTAVASQVNIVIGPIEMLDKFIDKLWFLEE